VAKQPAMRAVDDARLDGDAYARSAAGAVTSYRPDVKEATLARLGMPTRDDFFRLSALWVGGLMLLVVLAVHLLLQGPDGLVPRKLYDWALYVPLGLAFALSLGFAWYTGRQEPLPPWALWLPLALTASTVAATLFVMIVSARWTAIPLAVGQTIGLVLLLRRTQSITTREIAPLAATALAAWVATVPMIWWEPLQSTLRQPAGVIAILLVGLGVTWWAVGALSPEAAGAMPKAPRVWAERTVDVAAIAILLLLSFRTDGLIYAFQPIGVLSHWGAFVGPAQQVQEGGWLLWDVPAMYGFLLTWTLAALPFGSAWQSLYVLNAAALLLAALALYGVLRALRPDFVGKIVALAATIPATFLAASWSPNLQPTHYFPSFGALRYLWCYVLIAILALESRQTRGSRGQIVTLAAGTVCWLIAVLWSFETAVFCTAIWLPAYSLIVVSREPGNNGSWQNVKRRVRALVLPFVLLAALAGAVAALYAVRLGHLPDVRGYVEYVLAFGSGEVSQNYHLEQNVLDYSDVHLTIFLVLALVGAAGAMVLRVQPNTRELPLLLVLWAGVWLISGYSVGRPHPHTVSRSWPIMLVAVAVSILVVARYLGWRPTLSLRAAMIPFVTMMLALTYSNLPELERNIRDMATSATPPWHVAAGLPDAEPALQELLTRAGIGSDEPFVYDGDIGGNVMPAWVDRDGHRVEASRTWLPNPLVELILVPEERRRVYMQRMADRRRTGGWYVQRNGERTSLGGAWEASGPWLFGQLARTHTPTRAIQNDAWQLVWFDFVGASGALGQPVLADGKIVPAPPQLSIDDTPINARDESDVWMIPAEGWVQDSLGRGLLLNLPARASVFSDEARRVRITLFGVRKIDAQALELRLDGDLVGHFVNTDRRTASIEVELAHGWNELTVAGGTTDDLVNLVSESERPGSAGSRGLLLERFDISTRGSARTAE
jgi:hypothetical protein